MPDLIQPGRLNPKWQAYCGAGYWGKRLMVPPFPLESRGTPQEPAVDLTKIELITDSLASDPFTVSGEIGHLGISNGLRLDCGCDPQHSDQRPPAILRPLPQHGKRNEFSRRST